MGIRINKTLGWILEDEKIEIDQESDKVLKDLVSQEKKDMSLCLDLPDTLDLNKEVHELVVDLEEVAKRPLYIFVPPAREDWHRYDSPIDYYEAKDGGLNIEYINKELFPYHENFVISKTGRELSRKESDLILMTTVLSKENFLKLNVSKEILNLGIDINENRAEQIHQLPPKIVRLIAKHFGVKDIKKLKPALLTYWN